ncbi:flavodoxin [Sporomusa acidovorans]|uniref:Flavodoxin-like domain-containing protein n=1 Tax=Sporomusa acidovorans (strain ATCC 49682 / DSM 3132 / Mol) TaxID=1123286 RepID=A0ABZ3J269_SPOA4|nr:flavodoxin [Sporomusa acidovorans]OZC24169.1 flavodoxin [Sporomusa acidovorans DSM 3132]SDF37855.1 Flavodoxin [Sporomusa acidovorans]
MKKYIVLMVAVAAVGAFAAMAALQKPAAVFAPSQAAHTAAAASQTGETVPNIPKDKKALVVYFSYSGNTRIIAEQIRQSVDGDIVELQPLTPYSADYDTVVKQGKQEIESGFKPPLKAKVESLAAYDVIFVGTPIWWYTIAPPVASFLAESDLAGKTIIPFCTHGGYGPGHNLEDIKKLAPKSRVLNELVLNGSKTYAQKDILAWLSKVGFGE